MSTLNSNSQNGEPLEKEKNGGVLSALNDIPWLKTYVAALIAFVIAHQNISSESKTALGAFNPFSIAEANANETTTVIKNDVPEFSQIQYRQLIAQLEAFVKESMWRGEKPLGGSDTSQFYLGSRYLTDLLVAGKTPPPHFFVGKKNIDPSRDGFDFRTNISDRPETSDTRTLEEITGETGITRENREKIAKALFDTAPSTDPWFVKSRAKALSNTLKRFTQLDDATFDAFAKLFNETAVPNANGREILLKAFSACLAVAHFHNLEPGVQAISSQALWSDLVTLSLLTRNTGGYTRLVFKYSESRPTPLVYNIPNQQTTETVIALLEKAGVETAPIRKIAEDLERNGGLTYESMELLAGGVEMIGLDEKLKQSERDGVLTNEYESILGAVKSQGKPTEKQVKRLREIVDGLNDPDVKNMARLAMEKFCVYYKVSISSNR